MCRGGYRNIKVREGENGRFVHNVSSLKLYYNVLLADVQYLYYYCDINIENKV